MGDLRGRSLQSRKCIRNSNVFPLYAKIFRALLSKWQQRGDERVEEEEDEYGRELDRLVLPSDENWRTKAYYHLVEAQRVNGDKRAALTAHTHLKDTSGMYGKSEFEKRIDRRTLEILKIKTWDWEPDSQVTYPLTPRSSRRSECDATTSTMLEENIEPGWRLKDILLAARILRSMKNKHEYTDEAEMRRVYGLVYDVLRYRRILNCALVNAGFWCRYVVMRKQERLVWLLLYDMYSRKFAWSVCNNSYVQNRNQVLTEAGLLEIENALNEMKTKIAAVVSRLRIGSSALTLDELLPFHLRTAEGVTWGEEGSIASGWVNSAKIRTRRQFIEEMNKLGLSLCLNSPVTYELEEHQYVFDPLCPKVINLHERARERLAASDLVRKNSFIFLERSFCLGAATLVQAVKMGRISGSIILTHSLAPRHTGYLIELLADLEDAGKLLIFDLGDNCARHLKYLQQIEVPTHNCKLFSERYSSKLKVPEIDEANVVLATPPCSYTGVRDVVDLAIARDGDLELLESLTSLEAESCERPEALLAEQMSTLKDALTRPNIQLLVYEVHTLLPCETVDMINQVVEQVNQMAIDKFYRDKAKRKAHVTKEKKDGSARYADILDLDAKQHSALETIAKIPESDLFETVSLNDIYEKDCSKLLDQGSFVVLLKRKEITKLNSEFMIKIAERKGLFNEAPRQLETLSTAGHTKLLEPSESSRSKRRKLHKIQFNRITAPTHASKVRALSERSPCPRHEKHIVKEVNSREKQVREARRRDAHHWWDEVAQAWRYNSMHTDDYQYQALKTDPFTRRILFPSHIKYITYTENQATGFAPSTSKSHLFSAKSAD